MKISAVIPAYNSQDTVAQTIKSVLVQDLKFNEIIVIDDGSEDKTVEIVSKYPVRLIKKEQNQGGASALNTGIKEAKGDFLAIIESDVILPKNWLSSLIEEFKDSQVYGAGAVLKPANPKNILARLIGYELEYKYLEIKDKFVFHITTANVIYRKEAFAKAGCYDESLINASYDALFNQELTERGCKLVLRKDIKVKHFWKTSFISYIKRQFAYSFYRPRLKKIFLYPTDILIIPQIFLTALFLFFILFSFFQPFFLNIALLFFFAVILFQMPIVLKMFEQKKDPVIFLLPFLIFLRNIIALIGYSLGLFNKYLLVIR